MVKKFATVAIISFVAAIILLPINESISLALISFSALPLACAFLAALTPKRRR